MQRTESEIERLVRENRKLVQYQVNRYLKQYAVRGMERGAIHLPGKFS
jgi:uncharacterized protein YeeX (DUF496 family)